MRNAFVAEADPAPFAAVQPSVIAALNPPVSSLSGVEKAWAQASAKMDFSVPDVEATLPAGAFTTHVAREGEARAAGLLADFLGELEERVAAAPGRYRWDYIEALVICRKASDAEQANG
jgi:hypothetical protein